jgi:uncharacterized membrane protein
LTFKGLNMATVAAQRPNLRKSSILRPKHLIFIVIGVMMVIVLHENEYFLIDHSAPVWAHYEPFKWWLLPHGLFGAMALLLGPFQFSDRLRQRFAKFHRVAGRFYAVGVLVAAPLGVIIQKIAYVPGWVPLAVADATLWTSLTAIGFVCALRGDFQEHKKWMTRSFAVALVFLEGRVWFAIDPNFDNLAAVWICLAAAVPLADTALLAEEWLRKGSRAKSAAQSPRNAGS